jgi:hypothetical protein
MFDTGVDKAPLLATYDIEAITYMNREVPFLWDAFEIFKKFSLPEFLLETEYVSLIGMDDYLFISGDLISGDGVRNSEDDYRAMTNEKVVDHSTSKFAKLS